ncbi:p-hydroxybenzoate hydroxylase [Nymphon striatum]|nr:p-hydroxybenzoate hydroxylase [Nymphon striatum]
MFCRAFVPAFWNPDSVDVLRKAGVGDRMDREGIPHDGCYLTDDDLMVRINFHDLTGKQVMVYGQTEVTADLYDAQDAMGTKVIHGVEDVVINDAQSDAPSVDYNLDGVRHRIDCSYVAGCDGFHGVSRKTIPAAKRAEFEAGLSVWMAGRVVTHAAGQSRTDLCQFQPRVPLSDRVEDWSDDRFWEALQQRLPQSTANTMVTGPSIEKSIAPLRSFVSEPLRWGRLFLVGDAAHIVPPTGAKGLNLAVSDCALPAPCADRRAKAGRYDGH